MDRNRELLRRFEEQTLQMKEMNRELVDARSQLSMTATGSIDDPNVVTTYCFV